MVGIVVVSHSQKLAEGVVELARMMASDVHIAAAGGLEDGSAGTSFEKIEKAINEVYSEEGVAVFMDMGSAVMTAEMVMESMPDRKIEMVDCPIVEGAVVAALNAVVGSSLEEIKNQAVKAQEIKKIID